MPNIIVIKQASQSSGSVTGATYGSAVSLDGALTLSAQVNVTAASSPGSATALIQVSDDATDVSPSNWTNYVASQAVSATGSLFFEKINPTGNWARVAFAISSGSFSATTNFVVKGPA